MYNPYYFYNQQNQPPQQNGIIIVRSEEEARNYPIAYGNSVTFKDESSPYVYTKTMGFSQLDKPVFEKFKLVKENSPEIKEDPLLELKEQIKTLQDENENLWREINFSKERKRGGNNEHNGNGKSV